MKRGTLILVVVASLALVADFPLSARGPGGGGGGRGGGGGGGGGSRGGGGASRSAPAASRSPAPSGGARTASRPSTGSASAARPSTGGAGARPSTGTTRPGTGTTRPSTGTSRPGGGATASRPSTGQVNDFLDVPRASTGAVGAGGARTASGGAAADFLQQGGGAATARTGAALAGTAAVAAGATGERRQNVAQNQGQRIENREQVQESRGERANEIHEQCNDTPIRDFWSDHPVYGAFAITRPFRYADWGMVDDWVGYGEQPAYYNYGENVYYEDGAVYSDGQQVATEEEYAQQAEELAASAPESSPEGSEWMSLGVFALTQDGEASGAQPTLYMQLVLSKQGVISGTFENKTTSESQILEGMVDVESQRAAWGVEGQARPIIESGISNLTQDTAPALIHFADGQTQQWLLVRLEEPEASN